MKAVYAGSFDPFTFGHLEIVREASKFFDEVIILCAVNSKKSLFFSRAAMITGIEKCLEAGGAPQRTGGFLGEPDCGCLC